jgi:hypothetical protein
MKNVIVAIIATREIMAVAIQREFKHDMDELGKSMEGVFQGDVT